MEQMFAETPKPAEMSSADGPQALDSSQLPDCAPTRSQAEMEEHMGCRQSEGVHKTPTEPLNSTQLPEYAHARKQPEAEEYMGCLQTEGVHKTPTELLDSSQLPECAPAQNQAVTEEYMGCLQTKGVHQTPTELPDIKMESPQDAARPPRSQQQSLLNDEFPAQTQQARLFNDPRRHKLFGEYNEVIRQNPDSHLARLGELAHYVFDNGRPARVWTAGGVGSAQVGLDPSKTSIHGRCSFTYDEADILLLTESEHAAWSRANNPPKLVVIRDPEFSRRRPAKSTESWLREQEKRTNKKWVDVQRLNRQCNDGAAENIPLQDAIQQWRTSQTSDVISLETPPMNLLNISDKTVGHWPEGLAKDYQLLFEAIDECESMIYRSLDERLVPLSEQDRGIGKTTLMLFSHSDIQKCTQFRILAHRGACSSWHIDNAGVYTFIVLESNIDSPDEQDEDVVKYWPVYPTHHMNAQDEDAARLGFSKEGINWRPKPDGKIPVIALIRGDMLIQPPGTIHAPITLTNCFFLGGMAWRKNTLPQTLNVWHYLMKNEICTNEPLPRQSQAILDFIKVAVHDAPEEHGYRQNELGEFDKICDEISGMVSRCGCSKACSLSTKCSCLMQGLKCGIRCHKGSTLHYTTCTTVNMLSPASLSGGRKYTKRIRLKDDEDSDYTSNGTPVSKTKRKKREIEALQANAPSATLDAIALLPHEHLNNSPMVAGSDYTPNATSSGKPKRKPAVKAPKSKAPKAKAPEAKALDATALLPNAAANNSPAVADSVEVKRPEICAGLSTGGICEYDAQVSSNGWVCKHCHTIVDFGNEAIGSTRSRASKKSTGINENDNTILSTVEQGAPPQKKCGICSRTDMNLDTMKRGPNGPRTACSTCGRKWAKTRREKEANNEAAALATLLPSIEKGELNKKRCDICHKTDILVDRRGPNGTGTLCWTCGRKWSKENAQREANNKGEAAAFDEAKATSGTCVGTTLNTMSRSSKSQTPGASKRQSRPLKEGYCLQCKATKSTSWHGYEDSTGKGKRCGGCYYHAYGEVRKERKRSLASSKSASPSPAKENEAVVRSGLKFRLSPAAYSAAKKHNADKMDKNASQQDPPVQFQSGILPPLFNAPPSRPQENTIIHARNTNLSITVELPATSKQQELAQHEPAAAYPLQDADPQVLVDLQSYKSHEATPEPSVEHKLEADGFMVSKPEPQTFIAFAQDDEAPSKSLNVNTKPEAVADTPVTNGSTTTESSAENSNSHTSSPLSAPDDGLSDRENADLFIPR
ncbi:hypothetical protein V501_00921 [Pseudogymnoascus sp. VKM F-4519 (FW-2642)]|nr:hypothetical protein V501_00921 [Pseudogymnoascus sp. VKM F-4519 (FW-2642)]